MKLYTYWRSTTSFRVRAALNLKRVPYDQIAIDLVAGEQNTSDYAALNPAQGVPTLVLDDGTVLTQSLAIIDYLDATYPEPPMLPGDATQRAQVLATALGIAMDIHPVNNLRVIAELKSRFDATPQQAQAWMCHWMAQGFDAVETMVRTDTPFAFGDAPDLADLCIVAQFCNAHRWGLDVAPYPNLCRIEENALSVPAIAAAHPDQQPDAKVTA